MRSVCQKDLRRANLYDPPRLTRRQLGLQARLLFQIARRNASQSQPKRMISQFAKWKRSNKWSKKWPNASRSRSIKLKTKNHWKKNSRRRKNHLQWKRPSLKKPPQAAPTSKRNQISRSLPKSKIKTQMWKKQMPKKQTWKKQTWKKQTMRKKLRM